MSVFKRIRGLLAVMLASGALAAAWGASAAPAGAVTTVTFCTYTYGNNEFCNRGASFSIVSMYAQTNNVDAFCVYRATQGYAGSPSASGNEYCIAQGNTAVQQSFNGLNGYPATHNRHSYQVQAGASYDRN